LRFMLIRVNIDAVEAHREVNVEKLLSVWESNMSEASLYIGACDTYTRYTRIVRLVVSRCLG
jgi:hypothetical protein